MDDILDVKDLELKDPPILAWVAVNVAAQWLWRDNPKRHDMQLLADSIARYGFQEPAKYDVKLHRIGQGVDDEPQGAIKTGNGRIQAVAWMQAAGRELPRGCAEIKGTGQWAIPVLFGTDARSGVVAQAYAIDANNLTLAGGDFDGFDYARLWDERYVELLQNMDELPTSVDAETVAALVNMFDPPHLDELEEEFGEPDPRDGWPFIRVCVSPDVLNQWNELMDAAPAEDQAEKVEQVLDSVDVDLLMSLGQNAEENDDTSTTK